MTFDRVPKDLQDFPQWINWRGESDPDTGKIIKRPVSPHNGRVADAHDPSNWTTFENAVQRAQRPKSDVDGIGFVLTESDPFVGIDLDNCIDDAGAIAPWADDIVRLMDSYTEITPSGHGLRIFVRGTLPPVGRKKGDIEMYSARRFLTVTGAQL